jgi:sulfate transport system substrate-binding protein
VPADLCLVALESDAVRIAEAGLAPLEGWRQLPHQGTVNRSPFVILVRAGNPQRIADFEDLARPGVGVVHPDPLTSGGANWSILAEYGAAARRRPDDPEAGYRLLLGIWRNVVAQAGSARAARTQFQNGFGDALVTYEQDALADRRRGRSDDEIVYPHSTVLSEHTLVVLERNIGPEERVLIGAFVEFLWSAAAQRLFVEHGFRSVDAALNADASFGVIADPFTVTDFGGWPRVRAEIVQGVWQERVLRELER